jgi:N-acetylmuramoyl-L-alanine amidase
LKRLTLLLFALACAAPAAAAVPSRPPIVWKPIPFGPARQAETAAYERRHYGLDRSTFSCDRPAAAEPRRASPSRSQASPSPRHCGPHVIVEHYTANDSLVVTWSTFASDAADPELHERPGTCAQFVIDRDGTIYQLVRLPLVCRHTVGLNWTAIGIEHVGTSDAAVLRNPRQLAASLALTLWLAHRYGIARNDVIGHNESLRSRFHRERYPAWRCQTHGDWTHADMELYRARLGALARREGVALPAGPPLGAPSC